jgi:hypothetical protein
LVVTSFHKSVGAAIHTAVKSQLTLFAKLGQLIGEQYKTSPSFEQYRNDQAALAEIAKERGLTDAQYYRKAYASAIKDAFGELPVSMDAASVAKRKAREAAGANKKAGAVKGETAPRKPAASETIEQLIARIGVFKVLETCAKLLETEESTKDVAKNIRALKVA